jgi:divalent metal cation (Fe/Co/Zn/Cd) transporter
MDAASSSRTAVYAALFGNVLVAVTKVGAAIWTGSSAMTSEAVHSVVDTSNEVLLLYGYRRASRPRTSHIRSAMGANCISGASSSRC